MLVKDYPTQIKVSQLQISGPRPILKAQAHRGFANLSEATLQDILEHKGVALPTAPSQVDAPDARLELALAAMKAIEPDWTHIQAARAMHVAFLIEHPDTYLEMPVDSDVLSQVVTPSEAKQIAEFQAQIELTTSKKTARASALKSPLMKKYFKSMPVAPKQSTRASPRWIPQKHHGIAQASAYLESYLPSSVKMYTDEKNGRWKLMSGTRCYKSVSWTGCGIASAVARALHLAWSFHMDSNPWDGPDWDMKELTAQFEGDDS